MKPYIVILIIVAFATACNSQEGNETKHKAVIFKEDVFDLDDFKMSLEKDTTKLNVVWNINNEKTENNIIKPHSNKIIKDNDGNEFIIKFTEVIARELNKNYTILLRDKNTKKEIWTYSNFSTCYFGHTIQLIVEDNKIIIATHNSIATGSDLFCLDIYTGKEIWRGDIKQLKVIHSRYNNSMYIKIFENNIILAGDESGGNYFQIIDVNTGKNLYAKMENGIKSNICKTFDCLEKNKNTKIEIEGFLRKYTPNKSGKGTGYMFWDWEILLSDGIAIPVISKNKDVNLSNYENKNVSVNCTIFYGIIIGSANLGEQNATGYRIDIDLIEKKIKK